MAQPTEAGDPRALRGIASIATRHLLDELVPLYRQRSSQRLEVVSTGGVDAVRRVEAGEALDFVILAADAIDRLVEAGAVVASSVVGVARSGVAIAVRAGSPVPDVATEDAVRRAVLGTSRIGYSTGPSGTHLMRLVEKWGIGSTVASRLVQAPPGGPVATLLARGEVQLGFQQTSELVHAPGIRVAGPLPAPIQRMTLFAAGACPAAPADGVGALLAFLSSPDVDAVRRRHGLEPATDPVGR